MNNQINTDEVEYASLTARIAATVIDVVLSALILFPILSFVYKYIGIEKPALSQAQAYNMRFVDLADILIKAAPSLILETAVLAIVVILLWVYKAATPGKIILNMQIVDAKTHQKPGVMQSVVRYFAYIVSFMPLYLGFIWIYFDKRKQGFHDKIAGTVVIKVKR
jgi:uncharacterized RDD family membrane protein YckC